VTPPACAERRALPRRRVAITGAGALSPGGVGIEAYRRWLPGSAGERIPGFNPAEYVRSPKLLRSMHRTFQLVAAASVLAMRAAGLPGAEQLGPAGITPERAGIAAALADMTPLTSDLLQVLAATGPGAAGQPISWSQFADLGLHKLHPFRRLTLLANMAAAHTSLLFGLQGPSFTFTSGGAAGAQTLAQAYWTITHDRADLMLCQTADSPEQSFSAHPAAELAGAVVLEHWESAQRRGVPVIAELVADAPGEMLPAAVAASPAVSLMHALLAIETPHAQPLRLSAWLASEGGTPQRRGGAA